MCRVVRDRRTAVILVGHTLSDAEGILLAVDGPVAELLQRERKDLLGLSYLQMTYSEDRGFNERCISGLKPDAGPIAIRKRYIRGDGSPIWVNLEASRLGMGSDAGRMIGAFRLDERADDVFAPRTLRQTARNLVSLHRLRRETLGNDLFPDSAWVILLQLYLAEAEGRVADEAVMARTAGVSGSVVRRWTAVLAERGLLAPLRPGRSPELALDGMRRIEDLLSNLPDFR